MTTPNIVQLLENPRPFEMDEVVKLRSKPGITGKIDMIYQVNNQPAAVHIAGWGDRHLEEIQHLDEPDFAPTPAAAQYLLNQLLGEDQPDT